MRISRLFINRQIADHPVTGRMRTCCQRRMTNNGLCVGMRMVRVSVNDTFFQEVAKAAVTEPLVIAGRKVAAQLVHGNLQDQPWLILRAYRLRNKKCRQQP